MRGIIVAGGLGTRLKPLTDTTPKPLLPIREKPIVEHAIYNLVHHGIKDIILSTGYYADKIRGYFGDGRRFGARITYSHETEPLGTGGAIKLASGNLYETFLLLWGDNLSDVRIDRMLEVHRRNSAGITLALTHREDTENFGCAKLDGTRIITFVEKPKREEAPSNLINAGIFVVEPRAITILPEGRSSFEKDCLEKLCGKDGNVHAYLHEGQWYPTDTLEKYSLAQANFRPMR